MKYAGMPAGMWLLFAGSFRKHLNAVFGFDKETASAVTAKAKPKYREIIGKLPEFEKTDRFKMNIVNCAMLSAFVLAMEERPSVEKLTEYYAKSMMTGPMRWFCRMGGKRKFSEKDIQGMKATAALHAADRNPYSWNILSLDFPDNAFDKVVAANVIHLLDEPLKALGELNRVCRPGGMLIIPTYMNRDQQDNTSGFASAVGKAGADFKRQFTVESYRQFFLDAGYRDEQITTAEGRIPCAVAVMAKK